MKTYLGEIYLIRKPKKNTMWQKLWNRLDKDFVHKFSQCVITAETYTEANEKMKVYADEYVAKAKRRHDAGFMKDLVHESFVTEEI